MALATRFSYDHDGYGNEPFETDDPKREWAELKALGGEWAEIGDLHWTIIDGKECYVNDQREIVFTEV